jgi:hypothetical protein
MNRRIPAAALVAFALGTITTGCSVEIDGGDAVTHQLGSDYIGAGGMINLTDPVAGDAILAGGRISTANEIQGDLVVAGGELSIGGAIGDDLYAAGGDVQLDALVSGNARLAGGALSVGPATVVAGALSLAGGRVRYDGSTRGNLSASGGSVRLNGEVLGDAKVRAEDLEIGPDTRIGGRLVYHGPTEPVVPEGAVIAGGIEFHEDNARRYFGDEQSPSHETEHGVGSFLWFLGVFLAAALFLLLLPRFASDAAATIGRRPMAALGLGLAILLCVPFIAVVLLVTIIGIPLALLLMSLYVLVLFLGWVTAALFLAQRGLAALRPGRPVTRGWQLVALLLGLVALWLLRQVPFAGALIGFLALIAGIGALAWRTLNRRDVLAA